MVNYSITPITYPVAGVFRIARSAVTDIHVVQVSLTQDDACGRGECRPYPRYGDTVESVVEDLESVRVEVESRLYSAAIAKLPAGRAKNALSNAVLDLESKRSAVPVWKTLKLSEPTPRETAFTLSWDTPAAMAAAARAATHYSCLKIKIAADGLAQLDAVTNARPDARLIIDANEALSETDLPGFLDHICTMNVILIEQPLPAGHQTILPPSPFPICADEGLHDVTDLPHLIALGYGAVNVKLDKCGGLVAGVALMRTAKAQGLTVMAGCMVGSSLAMAPMMVAESLADVIDLDGPLLLARDIEGGLRYDGATVYPPTAELWG